VIRLADNKLLLEPNDVLPEEVTRSGSLFLDFETSSGRDDTDSLNPWIACDVAGIAITVDENPQSWYVPIGHRGEHNNGRNLDRQRVTPWLAEVISGTSVWVNHNIKYDAHVLWNCMGIEPAERMLDTLTIAKLKETDREFKGGYGLKVLAQQWCGAEAWRDEIASYLDQVGSKDYGIVPVDTMGLYACNDVLENRKVHKYLMDTLDPQCYGVAETEIQLTRVLYEMERTGLHVDMARRGAMEHVQPADLPSRGGVMRDSTPRSL